MKKKILSLLTAFAMVFGIIAAPFTSASADGEKVSKEPNAVTNTVTLHKLMMTKEELKAWDSDAIEKKENGYDGTQDLDALKALLTKGHSAHEADNVFFAWQVKGKETTKVGGKTVQQYIKAVIDNQTKKPKVVEGKISPSFNTQGELELTTNLDEAFGGLTANKSGIKFDTAKLKGEFLIQEIKEKSTYQNEGKTIVDQKAVPVVITLPLVNDKGTVLDAHVYPKNTDEKPSIDKNFAKAEGKEKELEAAEGFNAAEDGAGVGVGADYKNYQKNKATAKAEVGKKIPYEVKTKIEAGTGYERLVWTDKMTKGLTYNYDLAVTADNNITFTKDTDYEVVETNEGFRLIFTKSGLDKVNKKSLGEKDAKGNHTGTQVDVNITLKYSATVNGSAVVDQPDKNEVQLEYGHKPTKENKPKEGKPSNQTIKVTKSWDDGVVTADDQKTTIKYTLQVKEDDGTWKDVQTVDKAYDSTNPSTSFDHTFTGLDDNKTYRVIEKVTGYAPEYASFKNGVLELVNHKDNDNPPPLKPTAPQVVTGGKRFVKTDDTDKNNRLAGAKFVIKKDKKYLAYKAASQGADDKTALDAAKKNYLDVVDKYNKAMKDAKTGEEDAAIAALTGKNEIKKDKTKLTTKAAVLDYIKELQETYSAAFKKAGINYEWVDSKDGDNVVVLSSDKDGRFEIQGLEYGQYTLVETQAPAGFAIRDDVTFTVAKGSYDGKSNNAKIDNPTHLGYDSDTDSKYGQQIKNKKVTIPQTGGIGSLIFIVAGAAIMIGAFVAYKKSQAVEA